MKAFRNLFQILTTALIFTVALGSNAQSSDVRENNFQGRTYHHLQLPLTTSMLTPNDQAPIDPDIGYRFSDGGMFEIYLKPDLPGVQAPDCSSIVIRMPWTDSVYDDRSQKVAAKRILFDNIEGVRNGDTKYIDIVLELDPYLEKNNNGELQLTQCVAFFRQAFGAYVDHDEPLGPME
ncbi:MAG: hypothetical protein ACFB2Z_10880 [Maricaulaceae bacterium]